MEQIVTDMKNMLSADTDTACAKSSHEEKLAVDLSEFRSTHREATLHVRNLTEDTHHKFPIFLPDAWRCGSFAYWSITGLLASLGLKAYSSEGHRHSVAWYRASLQYELGYLETSTRNDATVLKHKLGSTELIILLLARWSFGIKKRGGSDKYCVFFQFSPNMYQEVYDKYYCNHETGPYL